MSYKTRQLEKYLDESREDVRADYYTTVRRCSVDLNEMAEKGQQAAFVEDQDVLPRKLNGDHSRLCFLHAAFEALDQACEGRRDVVYDVLCVLNQIIREETQ